jgi:hypothetical protein
VHITRSLALGVAVTLAACGGSTKASDSPAAATSAAAASSVEPPATAAGSTEAPTTSPVTTAPVTAAPTTAVAPVTLGDACGLLTIEEVESVLPNPVKPGELVTPPADSIPFPSRFIGQICVWDVADGASVDGSVPSLALAAVAVQAGATLTDQPDVLFEAHQGTPVAGIGQRAEASCVSFSPDTCSDPGFIMVQSDSGVFAVLITRRTLPEFPDDQARTLVANARDRAAALIATRVG